MRAQARRVLIPEVIQSSAMDCGPASLKAVAAGYGIDVGYGRLREACSTDVDGTSIDTLEDVAVELGLEVEQVMVPIDHLLLPESEMTPSILVVSLAHSGLHFLVLWRLHGSVVQVMDPSVGRRFLSAASLLREVYRHEMAVDAAAWRAFAGAAAFEAPLERRLKRLGLSAAQATALLRRAASDTSWRGYGTLDAATRLLTRIADRGGIVIGGRVAGVLERLCADPAALETIPDEFWCVRPAGPDEEGNERILFRGATAVRVVGRLPAGDKPRTETATKLDPELLTALRAPEPTTWAPLYLALKQSGAALGVVAAAALAVSGATVLVQAILLRSTFELGYWLGIAEHRLGAVGVVAFFLAGALLLDLPIQLVLTQLGRKLEVLFRVQLQAKIPRIADQYFHSRLLSDMAERLHALTLLRSLPTLVGDWLKTVFTLVFTVIGVIWLAPWLTGWVIATAAVAFTLSVVSVSFLEEREMRVRSHGANLVRFYLDALYGVASIRAHGAASALMREQEGTLVQWLGASRRLLSANVVIETLQAVSGAALAIGLIVTHVAREGTTGSILLVTYWALQLPALAQRLAVSARQVPPIRNTLARVLEPLSAPEETEGQAISSLAAVDANGTASEVSPGEVSSGEVVREDAPTRVRPPPQSALVATRRRLHGVRVELRDVSIRAGGHLVLEDVSLSVEAGDQVAVVGASGAGKSTLLGLFLGWHRPATGDLLVDGRPLTPHDLAYWRRRTAWVDPSVQLFNRRLVQNLLYGSEEGATELPHAIEQADLREVLERLPEGLQTVLGEGGALVSGGEGQRVRLGRAWLRQDVRLVLLDEPFRGLDRDKRRVMMDRALAAWAGATMICVTHDVSDTLAFRRVLVVEGGRIVEDGDPRALACDLGSKYQALLAAEQFVKERLWANTDWRRFRVDAGVVSELEKPEWVDVPELVGVTEAVGRGADD